MGVDDDYVCEYPIDGFEYTDCDVEYPCWIGDSFCDKIDDLNYFSEECNFDGGDCDCGFPLDGFNYTLCAVEQLPCWIGDGHCDLDFFNPACNFDGGDCECSFPDDGFDYTETCNVDIKCWIGDGTCDSLYSNEGCNFDGGDCEIFPTSQPTGRTQAEDGFSQFFLQNEFLMNFFVSPIGECLCSRIGLFC